MALLDHWAHTPPAHEQLARIATFLGAVPSDTAARLLTAPGIAPSGAKTADDFVQDFLGAGGAIARRADPLPA